MTSSRAPQVVLADDDVLPREGIASLLSRSGFEVVGQAGNSTELLALVRSAPPELAIIDIRMPPGHATEGLQAARVIREELPGTAIIVLSAHVEVNEAMDLLASGERLGYLLKSRVLHRAWKCGCQGTTIDSSTFESTHVFSAFPGRCPVIASISSSRNRVFVVIVKLIHSLCERSPKN